MDSEALIAAVASSYGVLSALAFVFQLARMHRTSSARDLSLSFLAVISGGYAIWLLYGISIGSLPLIVCDAIGLVMSTLTVAYALRLRHVWAGYVAPLVPVAVPLAVTDA